jgi:hypothetical protein
MTFEVVPFALQTDWGETHAVDDVDFYCARGQIKVQSGDHLY